MAETTPPTNRWPRSVIAGIALLAACSDGYSQPEVVGLVSLRYVQALDHDPIGEVIYYIGTDSRVGTGDQVIGSYDLAEGEGTVIDRFSPRRPVPWLGIGRDGSLFVLDNGVSFYVHEPDPPNERTLIVYRDGQAVERWPVSFPDTDNCGEYLDEGFAGDYLGVDIVSDGTGSRRLKPRFAVEGGSDRITHDLTHCPVELATLLPDLYLQKNLQALNGDAFIDSVSDPAVLWADTSRQFRYLEKGKTFGFLGNQPCERVFGLIEIGERRYNMGSCTQGVQLLPSSGHAFTSGGELIYVAPPGINQLR